MSADDKMTLTLLPTGVAGLDQALGGGLPEYSFNLIAGAPGAGKTTLAHQLMFANATAARPASYFTVLGEPAFKMMRYQQQMAFFDVEKIGHHIHFVNLSDDVLTGDLESVLKKIVDHVREVQPGIVIVDSFRTMIRSNFVDSEAEAQSFLQRLALHLASWQATSFLVGEYSEREMSENPVFTIADGIIWLTQNRERNAVVRKLQVVKARGLAHIPGLHNFRISHHGLHLYPRASWFFDTQSRPMTTARIPSGVDGLDVLLGGGVPCGDTTLVMGPSGTGKTTLCTQFLSQGRRQKEHAVLALFEETPAIYFQRADALGGSLSIMAEEGSLEVVSIRELDLSADEMLHRIEQAIAHVDAKRVVIDSLNGLEMALAPTCREDFRESLYHLLGGLTRAGVTVMLTVDVTESFEQIDISPHRASFLAQNIIFLRYVEIDAHLRKMLTVVKMRGSAHSQGLHEYVLTPSGMQIKAPLTEFRNLLSGTPIRQVAETDNQRAGLLPQESRILDQLMVLQGATCAKLASALHLRDEEVRQALQRLVALRYATTDNEPGDAVYKPASKPKP